jgi:hypothetical protein
MRYLKEANREILPSSPQQAIGFLEGIVIPHFEHLMEAGKGEEDPGRRVARERLCVCVHHRGRQQR